MNRIEEKTILSPFPILYLKETWPTSIISVLPGNTQMKKPAILEHKLFLKRKGKCHYSPC
ncbi:hypothetical protein HMPREF3038_02477 [Akkermansia sp. KLE1797]|nr:hypothetical protein HMPREF3038_02477 [Akkermansia sp. KLE1797]KXU54790.1 hypothetical protein HMPREF3039_00937 [Akkermansia sp. KLE1798]KZA06178.1 hypothetical protein HMPREF1326_00026 [Akkermansia sp. KLE1605]